MWSCCNKKLGGPACYGSDTHEPVVYSPGEVEDNWTFFPTPQYAAHSQPDHRYAVAVDCEMGPSATGENELIRVTVVDHATGIVLVDSLVWPEVPMQHYNTRFTGITTKDMHEARKAGTCLMGREAARQAVWQYVGPDTIVCLHSGQNDFSSLRWIHHRIIDTLLLEPAPVPVKPENNETIISQEHGETADNGNQSKEKKKKGSSPRSLQTLARVKLGREIQKKEHDSIEDAVATRDLVDWAVRYGPSANLVVEPERQVAQFVHWA